MTTAALTMHQPHPCGLRTDGGPLTLPGNEALTASTSGRSTAHTRATSVARNALFTSDSPWSALSRGSRRRTSFGSRTTERQTRTCSTAPGGLWTASLAERRKSPVSVVTQGCAGAQATAERR